MLAIFLIPNMACTCVLPALVLGAWDTPLGRRVVTELEFLVSMAFSFAAVTLYGVARWAAVQHGGRWLARARSAGGVDAGVAGAVARGGQANPSGTMWCMGHGLRGLDMVGALSGVAVSMVVALLWSCLRMKRWCRICLELFRGGCDVWYCRRRSIVLSFLCHSVAETLCRLFSLQR